MATNESLNQENQELKYLDQEGLKHLLTELKDANRLVQHNTGKSVALGAYNIQVDDNGHIIDTQELTIAADGAHTHETTVTIDKDAFLSDVSATTTNVGIAIDTASSTTTVCSEISATQSYLETTEITGVSGTTSASKVAQTEDVTYAVADTAVEGIALLADDPITYGNASVGTAVEVVSGFRAKDETDEVSTTTAYNATVNQDGCLILTPIFLDTTSVSPAVASESKAYVCKQTGTTIVPAKTADSTITTYTFEDVDVPVAATTATTVATGSVTATDNGNGSIVTEVAVSKSETVVQSLPTYKLEANDAGYGLVTAVAGVAPTQNTVITAAVAENGSHSHDFAAAEVE